MSDDEPSDPKEGDDCVLPPPPIPAEELARYVLDHDPDSESDIANYVEAQTRDETVQHVERIKSEFVLGEEHVIWDVTTDKGRWWVITNLTNLYSQSHFRSLDFTLSFHMGVMLRLRSRHDGADSQEPSPFDEVFRRQEQAKHRFDRAVEAEDFQAVGMVLRECLLSLTSALRRRVDTSSEAPRPQDGNFIAWTALIADTICPGRSNKDMRKYLKSTADDTWQLVGWLTHDRDANKTAASIAVHATDMVVGHFVQMLEQHRTDRVNQCPVCQSRNIRSHYDVTIPPDGDYYLTCGACGWSSHPDATRVVDTNVAPPPAPHTDEA
jgi:hypothetical protein